MVTVNLQDTTTLPGSFLSGLHRYVNHFKKTPDFEEIKGIPEVSRLIVEINDYCEENMVLGFHYCRAIPEDILTNGLLVRTGHEIRADFLNRFGHMFNAEEITLIKDEWASYFIDDKRQFRDSRIFFNFTTSALTNRGADRLLRYYGGEQVYFCIDSLPGIAEKLSSIGKPLIVKCSLNPRELKYYIEHPWGSIAVSTYHKAINPDAARVDQDGHQTVPVPPSHIEVTWYEGLTE